MICELCKIKEATIHLKSTRDLLDICNSCLEDLQTSLGYYIAGEEVVKEEYDQRTQNT
jgi:protein-arginine kinase activator protein McsA